MEGLEKPAVATTLYEDDVLAVVNRIARRRMPAAPIAFYGSSTFKYWRRMVEDFGDDRAVNLGFGGGTFASAVRYFDRLVPPVSPVRIMLYFGENDIANDGLTTDDVVAGFTELRAMIRSALGDVPVYFLSVKHSPARWLYREDFDALNDRMRELAAADPHLVYVDSAPSVTGRNGKPMSRLFTPDRVHLNDVGYVALAGQIRSGSDLFD